MSRGGDLLLGSRLLEQILKQIWTESEIVFSLTLISLEIEATALRIQILLNCFFLKFPSVFFHPLILPRVFSLEKLNHLRKFAAQLKSQKLVSHHY